MPEASVVECRSCNWCNCCHPGASGAVVGEAALVDAVTATAAAPATAASAAATATARHSTPAPGYENGSSLKALAENQHNDTREGQVTAAAVSEFAIDCVARVCSSSFNGTEAKQKHDSSQIALKLSAGAQPQDTAGSNDWQTNQHISTNASQENFCNGARPRGTSHSDEESQVQPGGLSINLIQRDSLLERQFKSESLAAVENYVNCNLRQLNGVDSAVPQRDLDEEQQHIGPTHRDSSRSPSRSRANQGYLLHSSVSIERSVQSTRKQKRARRSLAMLSHWRSHNDVGVSAMSNDGQRGNHIHPGPLTASGPGQGDGSSHSMAAAPGSVGVEAATHMPTQQHRSGTQINDFNGDVHATMSVHVPQASAAVAQTVVTSSNTAMDGHLQNELPSDQPQVSPKKLWQSLVLPIVLACVIFLVALWTRQISLALTNDTLVMMMILMAVFIIMSGVAFWLSCDQHFQGIQQQQQQQQQQQVHDEYGCAIERELADYGSHTQHQHQHHHHHHNHQRQHRRCHCQMHQNQQTTTNGQQTESHDCYLGAHCPMMSARRNQTTTANGSHVDEVKCNCSVSVIECQPPDYYAALRESLPISCLYEVDPMVDHTQAIAFTCEPSVSIKELYLLPPSYEEFTSNQQQNGHQSQGNHEASPESEQAYSNR